MYYLYCDRPPLTDNLRRRLLGQELLPWKPQSQFLGILGTGDGNAIASKYGITHTEISSRIGHAVLNTFMIL